MRLVSPGSIPASTNRFSAFNILDMERQCRNLSFIVARVLLTELDGFSRLDLSSVLANSSVCERS